MITSDDLAFFAVLAGSRSLAESAKKLNVTPPAITQRLRALEERVGVRLIDRAGRRLSLTDEGLLVASHGRRVDDALESLAEALADRKGEVRGHLRIAAPHGFGRVHVAPVAAAFARRHPSATVTLELSNHPAALLIESYDVVIHIGSAAGRMDQIVTTLAPNRRIACASPAYLDSAPSISTPSDLRQHRCLALRENDDDVTLWRFKAPDQEIATVRIDPAMSSNDGAVIREWALAGEGVVIRSEWNVSDDLVAGRLQRILPAWTVPDADIVAMLGPRHGRSARSSAFVTMMRESLAPPPWRVDTRQSIGSKDRGSPPHA